jgi:hypothetical protein
MCRVLKDIDANGDEELVILRFIVPSCSLYVNDKTGHRTGQ